MTDIASIYSAVYSGVPVFEMIVNGIAVMRRRTDSYMNATQILKVANIEKGKRTKILEKEVLIGEHEKVQGGYGKYQGTWIPYEKSRELAERYNVFDQLEPIFNFKLDNMAIEEGEDSLLTKEQAMVARKKLAAEASAKQHNIQPRIISNQEDQPMRKKFKSLASPSSTSTQPLQVPESSSMPAQDLELQSADQNRTVLMTIFLEDKPEKIPGLVGGSHFNPDMVIDEQGNTALHWAAALGRKDTLQSLVHKKANIRCRNYAGETALMRAVMVTNSFDTNHFTIIFNLLKDSFTIADNKKRTVLHHAALTAGIQGRMNASIYYLKYLVDHIKFSSELDIKLILNSQDSLGDTPLNIAARLDCQPLIEVLIEAGAYQNAPNKNNLEVHDYDTVKDTPMEESSQSHKVFTTESTYSTKSYAPSQRGKEIVATVQKIVDALDEEYGGQLLLKEKELEKVQNELDEVNRELESTRKVLEQKQAQSQKISEAQQKTRNIEAAIQHGWEELKHIMTQSRKTIPQMDEISQLDENEDIDSIFNVPDLHITPDATEEEKKKQKENYVKHIQAKVKAYTTNNMALERQIRALDEQYIENETQCKKLIAACCSLPIDKIDDLVEPLILAIESDPPDLDLARVIGFMDKIRRQGAYTEPVSNLPHSPQIE